VLYTVQVDEEIGCMPLAECGQPIDEYNAARDISFFAARPTTWLAVPEGSFAIFFPDDAHAPLAGRGAVKKAILKIAV
jgi:beta-galactosidase beta subunit